MSKSKGTFEQFLTIVAFSPTDRLFPRDDPRHLDNRTTKEDDRPVDGRGERRLLR